MWICRSGFSIAGRSEKARGVLVFERGRGSARSEIAAASKGFWVGKRAKYHDKHSLDPIKAAL